jgi:hypothetical protein
MLQIEIDTDPAAAPPEAFHADRLQYRPAPVPGPRAKGEQSLRQGDRAIADAAQEAVGQQ